MTRIAIVGLADGCGDAPFGEWECWGLVLDPEHRHKCDVLFEMHAEVTEIPETDVPLYGLWPDDGNLVRQYPLQDVIDHLGRDWFASGTAYMVGLAMLQGAKEIGLWGIHMGDSVEYAYQLPNLSWILGVAEGRGIKVTLPDGCDLLRYERYYDQYPLRYGYG